MVLDSSFDHDRAKRKARPAAVLALAGLLLGGCAATSVVNGLTPEDDFRLVADIRYGPEPRQALDIYLPTRTPLRRTPLVFVYGGAWERGDKADYLFVGQAFAELGYATVVPDYRLYPDASFPDFVDDVAAAVTTALGRLGKAACLDARRVVLVGHSAGAHTAALLALDPDYLARAGAIEPAALVGLAGPYDLPLDDPLVVGKFDRRSSDDQVRPVALVDARAPPALLLHGTADTAVDPRHTQRLRDRFAAAGVPVQVRLYPDTGHRMLVGALASPLRFLLPVRDDIADWLRAEGLDRRCADNMTQSPRPQRDGDNHERDRDQAVAPLVHHPDPTR